MFLNVLLKSIWVLCALVCGLFVSRWLLAVGKSEFGVCGGVGGMMVIEMLAGTMRLDRGRIAAVEDDMRQTYTVKHIRKGLTLLSSAVRQYTDIDPALGVDFEAKVEECLLLAISYPGMWREMQRGIRRALIRRFPFGIIYAYDEEVFYVLAVMHLHARPGYWKNRKKDSPVRPGRRIRSKGR